MQTKDFNYDFPKNLVAYYPVKNRDESRLLVVDRKLETIKNNIFSQIYDYLKKDDVVVYNNSKVFKARVFGKKQTGAKLEILILKTLKENICRCLIKPAKRVKINDEIIINLKPIKVINELGNGEFEVDFLDYDINDCINSFGEVPLPPYIKRNYEKEIDDERYQTIYAREQGSVAAPTAGLHFTNELLEKLVLKGVKFVPITLHVGMGTFKPIKTENVFDHKMDIEEFEITKQAAEQINVAEKQGRRIIAVGTTTVRTLEAVYAKHKKIKEGRDETDFFIYPGYKFKVVDALITNFHFPKSTLFLLVSAFSNLNLMKKAYREAVERKYRLFSYGDVMFIK